MLLPEPSEPRSFLNQAMLLPGLALSAPNWYCAICLHACYALSGTDIVYGRRPRHSSAGALSAYARAMQCPVLT
eukprot:1492709-Rhodomonas_salina.2